MLHKNFFSEFAALFLLYFLTARIGLSLDPVGGFATLVWPPTGIALAFILLGGYRLLPAIALAAFLVNLSMGAPFLVAVGMGFGNSLEAFIGAMILKKVGFRSSLERLSDVLYLILYGALISTIFSATIGSFSLLLGKVITQSDFLKTFLSWWVGDMLGSLIVAPLILVWVRKQSFNFKYTRFLEISFVVFFLLLTIILAFSNFIREDRYPPLTYLIFIPLIWLSLRFGPREVTMSNFLVSLLAIIFTFLGMGPFGTNKLHIGLTYLQIFVGVISITSLVIAAVISERNQLEQRKDEFISLASHELKTPLTVILSFNQFLLKHLRKISFRRTKNYLKLSNLEIIKLTKLINNLLDMSRIQAGKYGLSMKKFSLNEILTGVIKTSKAISHTRKIILKGNSKKQVFVDKDGIEQVLQNLISNAIKYSPAKSKILINISSNSQFATISVKDQGIGIPIQFKDKIFDRFYRVDDEQTKNISGLGLGLYLSSIIIKSHGGKIWFESQKGEGTTFYFTLPLGK